MSTGEVVTLGIPLVAYAGIGIALAGRMFRMRPMQQACFWFLFPLHAITVIAMYLLDDDDRTEFSPKEVLFFLVGLILVLGIIAKG